SQQHGSLLLVLATFRRIRVAQSGSPHQPCVERYGLVFLRGKVVTCGDRGHVVRLRSTIRMLGSLILIFVLIALSTPARALDGDESDPTACKPPRCVMETLSFRGYSFNFDVLLPSDYRTSRTRRYPVL